MQSSFEYDHEQKKLTVRGVTEFPEQVFEYANTLEILDMSNNDLSILPDNLSSLRNMRVAFFSGSKFKEFPSVFADCNGLEMVGLKSCAIETMGDNVLPASLRGLILTDNNLTELPSSIGEYKSLQKLMLTGNNLTSLPQSLLNLKQLELLRVAQNRLAKPPSWLSKLPMLAWYSDSGNDFSITPPQVLPAREFDTNSVRLGKKIGASAKNTVYSATLDDIDEVAVKIFGQGITTDGSPDNDIAASLLAGNHPTVIGGLGKISIDAHGTQGLVMPLIPPQYRALGLPPNFIRLTRDTYPQGTTFTAPVVARIAIDTADALQHIHSQGIMHGDVYAHNVLVNQRGESIVGDFGAASIYTPHLKANEWREKIDVAGYGHLLEELLSYVPKISSETETLRQLSQNCLAEDSAERPSFSEISSIVQELA